MALSDEWLESPDAQRAVKRELGALVSKLGARAAFLVDEVGVPFGTVGFVEFSLPHPLASLGEGEALLRALVGASEPDASASPYVVVRVSDRALLAVWLDANTSKTSSRRAKKHARVSATALAPWL